MDYVAEQNFSEEQERNDGSAGHELKHSLDDSSAGKLFVGGIAWETREESFRKYFSRFGEITDCVIMMDKVSGRPRGFGFVTFADPEAANKVLEEEHIIDGRTVEVKRTVPKEDMQVKGSPKTKKIFVGGLPLTLTEDELKEYFSSYGHVLEQQIMLDRESGRSRGFGFITFDSENAVEEVLNNGRMHEIHGKQVEIKRAEPKRAGAENAIESRQHRGGSGSRSYNNFGGSEGAYGGGYSRGYGGYGGYGGGAGYGGGGAGAGYGGYGNIGGSYGGGGAGYFSGYGGYGYGFGFSGAMYGAAGYGATSYGAPGSYGGAAGYGSAALGAYLCSSGLLRLNEVFFQSSVTSSSNWDTQNAIQIDQQKSEAAYDRLVVVLIDALRADMVLGSAVMHGNEQRGKQVLKEELNTEMPFTSGLVTSGKALGYVAHASVPTVTMPRLKALVTGKAPAFIDILKNFNSAALDEDANLVSLLTANGKRIVFYGDDTWLKLFPESFKRSDGTSGFYTRDTVEVDLNVTRHLSEELDPSMQNGKSGDWDALVLHYLGLDHVGHLRGPRSPLMKDKLHEMDDVVKTVVDSVRSQDAYRMRNDDSARPSLILVCSDHGMSEVGNHGGATIEESSALLMFMRGDGKPMHSSGEASYKQKRNQVDLVPTISSLFGLSIPLYSTGLMLEDVVRGSFGSTSHGNVYYLRALYRNFQQLHALAGIKFHQSELATFDEKYKDPLHKLRRSIQRGGGDGYAIEEQTAAAILEACEILQAKVAESDGSEYNSSAIFSGLALLFVGGVTGLLMLTSTLKEEANTSEHRKKHLLVVLVVGGVLWIASLSSSSSIENEHATAFFMTTTLLIAASLVVLQHKSSNGVTYPISVIALLLALTRMLRARNQIINFWRLNGIEVDTNVPGNEFASDDSVSILSTAALLPSGILPLGASVALIGGIVLRKAAKHIGNTVHKGDVLQLSIGISSGLFFLVGMVACLRVKELSDPVMNGEVKEWTEWIPLDADASAQVVYACVVFLAALAMVSGRSLRFSLLEMSMWLLVGLLQRGANFPTLTLICLQMEAVAKLLKCEQVTALRDSGVVVAGLALWLSQASFFALGNSHLVTTIDISQSYHGLSSYSQSLVGALTFVSVFSGPLVCFVNLFQWLDAAPSPTLTGLPKTNTRRVACLTLLSYQVLRFAVYTIVVYLMRFHLFIWSVFAPKMLYEFAHLAVSLVLVLLLNC